MGGAGGLSPKLLIGGRLDQIYQGNPELIVACREALAGSRNRVEWTSVLTNHTWDTFLAPFVDAQGRVLEACGVSFDLTPRRIAEEARRESEAKTRFLAIMSHELRTRSTRS